MNFLLTKKLKYFMAVMDKKCLTAASEELFITRSPLGKAIKELETTLGVTLFTKEHGALQPTQYAQNLHEITAPLYHKILDVQSHIRRLNDDNVANIIIDENYPDNFIDYIISILTIKNIPFVLNRELVSQNRVNEVAEYKKDLIITKTIFDTPAVMKLRSLSSSGFLLLANSHVFNDGHVDHDKLSNLPLFIKKNNININISYISSVFKRELGYCPEIKFVEERFIDMLYMTTAGLGVMLIPLKVFETLSIDRKYTIPVYADGLPMNFYYNAGAHNKTLQDRILDVINEII